VARETGDRSLTTGVYPTALLTPWLTSSSVPQFELYVRSDYRS